MEASSIFIDSSSSSKSNHSPVNNIIINILLLSFLTALFSTLLWIIPLLLPSSSLLSLFLSSLSHSFNYPINFPTPTFVFILGNLIVVLLIGESKIFSSTTPDPFGFDICFYGGSFLETSVSEGDQKRASESFDEEDEWEIESVNSEELSKRADDFIARVNMQRKIEAMMVVYCCDMMTTKKRYRKKYY
ncbi:Protoheme IX farnesyltransferase [Cucumis melo var. makuwa]|uniref:Protoheme IX farnesyltransferase n=1 Tax=Cucumis melo var. makuwa TaxID=1194695 RepID=A0A5A7UM42_CUCMM|nr:Protoheme IX farnesyltransferase [Cucumis melo var. makuwa]TYJ99272.1 Protoheme IX farnesyltransferase [Cucumis melo var. makuwa]